MTRKENRSLVKGLVRSSGRQFWPTGSESRMEIVLMRVSAGGEASEGAEVKEGQRSRRAARVSPSGSLAPVAQMTPTCQPAGPGEPKGARLPVLCVPCRALIPFRKGQWKDVKIAQHSEGR